MPCPLVGTKFCFTLLPSPSSKDISFQSISKEGECSLKPKIFFAHFVNGWVFTVVRKLKTRKMADFLSYTCLLVKEWKVQIGSDVTLLGEIPAIPLFPSLLTLLPIHGKIVWGSAGRTLCLHKNFGIVRLHWLFSHFKEKVFCFRQNGQKELTTGWT